MRRIALVALAAASALAPLTPANAGQVSDFAFPKNFVKLASATQDLIVRFRCPKGTEALVAGSVTLSPNDPAYDPTMRVYASMDYFMVVTCTGHLQTFALDLHTVSRGDADDDGGYPRAGQLVNVVAYTDQDASGRTVKASATDIKLRP